LRRTMSEAAASACEGTRALRVRTFTPAEVVLGLFVVWQMLFMLGSNALGLLKGVAVLRPAAAETRVLNRLTLGLARGEGPLSAMYDALEHWGHMTGQRQGWSLFSPNVAHTSRFPQLELRWESLQGGEALGHERAPIVLPPEGEPEDIARYFRTAGFRYRYWMRNLNVPLGGDEGGPSEAIAVRWQHSIRRKVMADLDTYRAFMGWRWRKFSESHPGVPPPTQMILHMRLYEIPPPHKVPWRWTEAMVIPVARGRLDPGVAEDKMRLDVFDPVTRRFVALDD
jgi:hypothetical protein